MFPHPESRFRTALRRSIDAAIDFATLGEYGLASAWEEPYAAESATAPRARQDDALALRAGAAAPSAATATATLVQPASAAGRARIAEDRHAAPACAGQHVRSRMMDPQLPRKARSRDGMAPREQRCLVDAA
jgi:hypothetical protein